MLSGDLWRPRQWGNICNVPGCRTWKNRSPRTSTRSMDGTEKTTPTCDSWCFALLYSSSWLVGAPSRSQSLQRQKPLHDQKELPLKEYLSSPVALSKFRRFGHSQPRVRANNCFWFGERKQDQQPCKTPTCWSVPKACMTWCCCFIIWSTSMLDEIESMVRLMPHSLQADD